MILIAIYSRTKLVLTNTMSEHRTSITGNLQRNAVQQATRSRRAFHRAK